MSSETGYICLEKETGAFDGTYTNESAAQAMAGYHQSLWAGSSWVVTPVSEARTSIHKFHAFDSVRKELESLYGPMNCNAGDDYDKGLGLITADQEDYA